MTNEIQVVARFKSDDPTKPRFTKTANLKDMMTEVMKSLPVDMIYMVIEHQDGEGYSLRKLGLLVADIAEDIAPLESQDRIPECPKELEDRSLVVAQVPPSGATPQVDPPLTPQVAPTFSPLEAAPTKKRKSRAKNSEPPALRSNGGRVQITSVTPGTPEQVAAVSHFKGF